MDIEQDPKKIDIIDKLSLDDLTVGEKFYFIKENSISSEGQIVTKYDNCFAVSIFSGQASYKPVAVNEQVNLIIANKDSAFKCISQVLGCKLEDGFQLAVLSIPDVINKIERRKHPRLQLVTAVDYYNLPLATSYKSINQIPALYFKKMKKTFTVDVSRSGINIVTYKEDAIPKEGIISLPLYEKIDILASIIRIDFDETNNSYKTAYEFKDIKKEKWDILNKFIDEKLKKQS